MNEAMDDLCPGSGKLPHQPAVEAPLEPEEQLRRNPASPEPAALAELITAGKHEIMIKTDLVLEVITGRTRDAFLIQAGGTPLLGFVMPQTATLELLSKPLEHNRQPVPTYVIRTPGVDKRVAGLILVLGLEAFYRRVSDIRKRRMSLIDHSDAAQRFALLEL